MASSSSEETGTSPFNTMLPSVYQKRPGFADAAGVQYERLLSALLFLRALNRVDSFQLAQNIDGVGAFDDNVLFCEEDKKTTAYFIQQKFRVSKKKPQSGINENLLKYYLSYKYIKEKYKVDELEVIYYTNSQILKNRRDEDCSKHILSTGGYRFHYTLEDENIHIFFSELIKYNTLLHELYVCSNQTIRAQIVAKKENYTCKELKNKLNKLEVQPSSEEIKNLITEIKGLVDLSIFQSFLNHLSIFQCQEEEKNQLRKLIEIEFHEACGTSNEMMVDNIIKFFIDEIDKWSDEKNQAIPLTLNSPLWKEVMMLLITHLNEPKYKELNSLKVKFNDDEVKACREKLQKINPLQITMRSFNRSLSLLKIHQTLGVLDQHLILSAADLQIHLSSVLQICQSKWCSALVIDGTIKPQLEGILKKATKKLFVVISRKDFTKKKRLYDDTCSLLELDELSQETLLNKPFNFQGYKVCLGDFLKKDSTITEIVCGEALGDLVTSKDMIEVGEKLQSVVTYYINRNLTQKRNIKKEILTCKDHNTLLAVSVDKKVVGRILRPLIKVAKFNDIRTFKHSLNMPQIIHLKNRREEETFKNEIDAEILNVHLLRKDKNGLYWKWSKGDMSVINHFIDTKYTKTYQESIIADIPGELRLIVAEPGMGKTTLLNHLAHQIKQADPTACIIRINLVDHAKLIKNISLGLTEISEFFTTIVSSNMGSNPLENELLEYIIHNSLSLVILLDGFDEMSPYYSEEGIKFIKYLQKEKRNKIWITCRSILGERLQNELFTLPFFLEPFSANDQMNFLKKYWKSDKIKPKEVENFVSAVLDVMKRSLGKQDTELAAIPLQTMLLAEAFRSAYEGYEKTGNVQLPKHLDVIELYDLFIDKKYEIFLESREGISQKHVVYEERLCRYMKDYNEKHCILALILLLSEEDLQSLKDPSIWKDHDEIMNEFEDIARVGIVSNIDECKAHFVHRTFAEYFVALWLINNFCELREFLKKKLFDPSFQFIRIWFDRMLAKKCAIHQAVLSNDEFRIRKLLNENVDMEVRDKGGRCPVHLAAMYGMNSILALLLSEEVNILLVDDVLGWEPIQYADRSESWGAVEMLLKRGSDVSELHHLSDVIDKGVNVYEILSLSFEKGYTRVIEFILSKGVKANSVIDLEGSTLLHRAARYGQTETLAYFLCYEIGVKKYGIFWKNICPLILDKPWSYWYSTLCVNKQNVDIENYAGYTPLHLAILGGHKDTAQWLLKVGGDINYRDGIGFTQLHWAVRAGCTSKVKRILSYNANINRLTGAGETPLHLAVKQIHPLSKEHDPSLGFATVKALLAARPSMYFEDSTGLTPLHWSSTNSNSSVLLEVIQSGADINGEDRVGSTALHWAAWRGNSENVEMLLQAGAQCNAVNESRNTPLHWAAGQGNITVVSILVLNHAIVNSFNNNGCTALCMAFKGKHHNVLEFLIQLGGVACSETACSKADD